MTAVSRGAGAVLVAALALAGCSAPPAAVTIRMRHSVFLPAEIDARAGATMTFHLVNEDPIPHEFVLGDEAEQQKHERAPDEIHDGQPGQASLAPGERKTITFRFGSPGSLTYGCHRPGHYAYGMRGVVRVR